MTMHLLASHWLQRRFWGPVDSTDCRTYPIPRTSPRMTSTCSANSKELPRVKQVGSGQVRSGQVGSGRVGSGRVGSGRVGSGRAGQGRVGQGRVFNVHIQGKLLQRTPVMGTHSSYQLSCLSYRR